MGKIAFLDNPFGPTAPAPGKARAQLEAYIERLIAALDDLDGDCDLEPGLDEDLEPDSDAEPDADDEPSLGRLETVSQNPGTFRIDWILDGEVQLGEEWRP